MSGNALLLVLLSLVWGCSGDNTAVVEWLSADAAVGAQTGSPVSFRDGSTMLGSAVRRVDDEQAEVSIWWTPGARSASNRFRFRLFPTDGGKAIDLPAQSILAGSARLAATALLAPSRL